MAIGKAECKCALCGETFIWEKKCCNSTDARSWEEYAPTIPDAVCPDCYKATMKAKHKEEDEKLEESLPEIVGASEKQIGYARKMRLRYIKDNDNKWEKIQMIIKGVLESKGKLLEVAEQQGKSFSEVEKECLDNLKRNLKKWDLWTMYFLTKEIEASKILDALIKKDESVMDEIECTFDW